jgi:hypothetical protein
VSDWSMASVSNIFDDIFNRFFCSNVMYFDGVLLVSEIFSPKFESIRNY